MVWPTKALVEPNSVCYGREPAGGTAGLWRRDHSWREGHDVLLRAHVSAMACQGGQVAVVSALARAAAGDNPVNPAARQSHLRHISGPDQRPAIPKPPHPACPR